MTDATAVAVDEEIIDFVAGGITVQGEVAQRLLAQAKEQGVSLTEPGGPLSQFTENVVETAENVGLTERLGREHGGILNGREHT